ncbi:MAG: hypothetical protein ACOYNC_00580 [Bacteroidales bacterium]
MNTKITPVTRSLRLLVLLMVLVTITTSAIFAQMPGKGQGHGKPTPEERAKRQTEMMKENLSLTAAQEPKVSAINLKYAKKMEDVRKLTDTAVMRKSIQNMNKKRTAN